MTYHPDKSRYPEIFKILSSSLGLMPGTAAQWWHAIAKSTHADTIAIRGLYQLYSTWATGRDNLCRVYVSQLSARRLVESLEALWAEGLLDRRTTTEIEERIFALTDQAGIWRLAQEANHAA